MSSDINSSQEKDLELVKLIKKGDNKALDSLLELYIPQLNAFFH